MEEYLFSGWIILLFPDLKSKFFNTNIYPKGKEIFFFKVNWIKSTGKGKSAKSYGAKRVKRTSKEIILGITKPAIRRLAKRVGIKRMSHQIYEETILENVVRDDVVYADNARRKTVIAMDVVYALERQGISLYGFVEILN